MSSALPVFYNNPCTTIVHDKTKDGKDDKTTVVIGNPFNFWRFNAKDGLDLTRRGNPEDAFTFMGTDPDGEKVVPVKLDRNKTALVVIDMQNLMLHPAMKDYPEGREAVNRLEKVIPACHSAGIQVIYLNWVFTKAELKKLPPSTIFGYGRSGLVNDSAEHKFTGPGFPLPAVQLEDGKVVDAGDMFMQGSWNAELYGPLQQLYEQSKDMQDRQDVILRTQWMNMGKELESFLEARGLTTLLFAGLNTEQAVWATMTEARGKHFDTIMLSDCCASRAEDGGKAHLVVVRNCQQFGGLVLTGNELVEATQQTLRNTCGCHSNPKEHAD